MGVGCRIKLVAADDSPRLMPIAATANAMNMNNRSRTLLFRSKAVGYLMIFEDFKQAVELIWAIRYVSFIGHLHIHIFFRFFGGSASET